MTMRLNGETVEAINVRHEYAPPAYDWESTTVSGMWINDVEVSGYTVILADDGIIEVTTTPLGYEPPIETGEQ